MDVQTIKLDLINVLLNTNDISLLFRVKNILIPDSAKSKDDEVIGRHPDGRPMTRKELWESIELSVRQIEKGETISHEDLIKESETW